jgi:hypothetical protein
MEDKRCPVFVDGKECGLPVILVDREAGKIARYDLGTYQCTLGHRVLFSARRDGKEVRLGLPVAQILKVLEANRAKTIPEIGNLDLSCTALG